MTRATTYDAAHRCPYQADEAPGDPHLCSKHREAVGRGSRVTLTDGRTYPALTSPRTVQ